MRTPIHQFLRSRRARFLSASLLALPLLFGDRPLAAQTGPGTVSGILTASGSGEPLPGASVRLTVGGVDDHRTVSDREGRFRFDDVRGGSGHLQVTLLGYEESSVELRIPAEGIRIPLSPSAVHVGGIVVSATRGEQELRSVPASIGVIEGASLRESHPSHPSEVMGRIPGVVVNVTGGEGHMTGIRQPITTDPVYLFLEDGIPTRSTGFFNHNALYEVNLPQADRIEVLKGPGTALHGSDAIGGVISVATREASRHPEAEFSVEGGAYGFFRGLGSMSGPVGAGAVRLEGNYTRTDGWRDGTDYDRISGTVRWDHPIGERTTLKAVVTGSRIDQNTAGTSALNRSDFESNPTANYTPISYREVEALRGSIALEHEGDRWSHSVTPFFRHNRMDMMPNWSLTFDPAIWDTRNQSLGLAARSRWTDAGGSRLFVVGVDADRSPGRHIEHRISPVREEGIFVDYEDGETIYDYDVTFLQFSPYLHAESELGGGVRAQIGVRADFMEYDYRTHLAPLETGSHRRPADTSRTDRALSPKVGLTWSATPSTHLFTSYRRGFRAPSEGQLFRQGSADNTVDLQAVTVDSWEVGARGELGGRVRYDLAAYHMRKSDDILTHQLPDGTRETVNAGETLHRGIEVGIGVQLARSLRMESAWSLSRHTYEEWSPAPETDLSGNRQEGAPRTTATTSLHWVAPILTGLGTTLEWVHLGPYFTDPTNTGRYSGHDLLNLRASLPVGHRVQLFARLANLANVRYAERAAWTVMRGDELAPGMPRTLHLGIRVR